MAFDPKLGLVIRYDFLWKEQQLTGQEEGAKDRPCVIILASKPRDDGSRNVVLCPITHAPPSKGETAVEIPRTVSRQLGLDDDRSWIKTHQVNTVHWEKNRAPYGVTPAREGQWAYGMMPQQLGRQAFEQVRDKRRERSLQNVQRDGFDSSQAQKEPAWRKAAREVGAKIAEPKLDLKRGRDRSRTGPSRER